MLSHLRNRAGSRLREPFGKAGLTVAVIALVFAMLGGAYAATNSGGGKATASKAKAGPRGPRGKTGPAGPAGPQGPAGANGKDGSNGSNGSSGANGKDGQSVSGTPIAANGACGTSTGVKYTLGVTSTNVCNGEDGLEGPEGEEGQPAGFDYVFSTSVAETDPGSGKLALNNAAPGSATKLSISETDADSNGLATAIAKWISGPGAQGTLMIRKAGAPGTFAEYTISANKDEGAFDNLEVAFVDGNGALANNDQVTVAYWSSGTATLAKGATETGAWSFNADVRTIKTEYEEGGVPKFEEVEVGDTEGAFASISFATPLSAALNTAHVHFATEPNFKDFDGAGGPSTEGCLGSVTIPTAPSGNLCVYTSTLVGIENATYSKIAKPGTALGSAPLAGAAPGGAEIIFNSISGPANASGVFAVTG